jgi:glycerol-3-phosphate dehydrogenase
MTNMESDADHDVIIIGGGIAGREYISLYIYYGLV